MAQITFDFGAIDLKVIIAALALVVTVCLALYQLWRSRKRLSYEVLSNNILISDEEEISDKVEIRYEGRSVKNVRFIVIRLINDGSLPIKKDDFEKPLRFEFPLARVLSAEKVRFHPSNMSTRLTYRDDWIELEPTLFNRKDYVQLKVLVSDYRDELKVDARIVGVPSIGKAGRSITRDLYLPSLLSVLTLGVLIAVFKLTRLSNLGHYLIILLTAALIGVVGSGVIETLLMRRKRQ